MMLSYLHLVIRALETVLADISQHLPSGDGPQSGEGSYFAGFSDWSYAEFYQLSYYLELASLEISKVGE